MADESWEARIDGTEVLLVRTVECVICCKRKRDRCHVCLGSGWRQVEHRLPVTAAQVLLSQLSLALGQP